MADKNLDLKEILARDPVAEAEAVLGVKLNTPESMADRVIGLAFLRHAAAVNRQKAAALQLMDDTCFSNTLKDYQRIVGDLGFVQVLAIDFTSRNIPERLFVYWRAEGGLLLVHDTFGGDHVNGGNFYYNWKPNPNNVNPAYDPSILSSGGWRYESKEAETELEPVRYKWDTSKSESENRAKSAEWGAKFMARAVWVGHHDCREALRHKIGGLESAGTFVTPWAEQPHLWLVHHGDTKSDASKPDYKAITNMRLAMLPEHVRAAIGAN